MAFKSPDEFREVMNRAFDLMSTDPEMGPRLREAQVPQRFEFPDVDMVVNVTYTDVVDNGGHNLRWEWSDDVPWSPEVLMTMDSEVANRYFQGRENIAMGIARRRITAGGDVKKALELIPVTKPVFGRYRKVIEDEYPHLAE